MKLVKWLVIAHMCSFFVLAFLSLWIIPLGLLVLPGLVAEQTGMPVAWYWYALSYAWFVSGFGLMIYSDTEWSLRRRERGCWL